MVIRWSLAVIVGVVVAALVGIVAWGLSPVAPALSGVVFAVCALPIGLSLGWIIAVAPKTAATVRSDDSVEVAWLKTALAGTATDLVLAVGLGLTLVSILRAELPTTLVLLAVLVVAFGSCGVRYAIERRRGVAA